MDANLFVAGLLAGSTRVRLVHTENEPNAPMECGELVEGTFEDVQRQINNPNNANRDDPMITVYVDLKFRQDAFDDGLRECSLSQVDCLLTDDE